MKTVRDFVRLPGGGGLECANSVGEQFRAFYASVLSVYNAYAFALTEQEVTDPGLLAKARLRADRAVSVDSGCLIVDAAEASGFAFAVRDTHAAAYALSAEVVAGDDKDAAEKFACTALKSARQSKAAADDWADHSSHTAAREPGASTPPSLLTQDWKAALRSEKSQAAKLRVASTLRLVERMAADACKGP